AARPIHHQTKKGLSHGDALFIPAAQKPLLCGVRRSRTVAASGENPVMPAAYPFSAIVGQEEMKLALMIAAVDPSIGGVIAFGDRGSGKSTAVRALAALLPKMVVVVDCRFGCDPDGNSFCVDCSTRLKSGSLKSRAVPVPVVDLPLGVTED